MPTPSRKTPRPPQRICIGQERRTVVNQAAEGRQRSSSNRVLRQAAERAKKETTRTIEAAQAKSQAGSGRSCLATRAWASGRWRKIIGRELRGGGCGGAGGRRRAAAGCARVTSRARAPRTRQH